MVYKIEKIFLFFKLRQNHSDILFTKKRQFHIFELNFIIANLL